MALSTVRAVSQPCGNGRWRVYASESGRGLTAIGLLSWDGKGYRAEFADGSMHENRDKRDLSWDEAESVLLFRYLQQKGEQIAVRGGHGSA